MSSNSTARRSINTPKGYQNQPGGRVNLYNQTYIGFVKEVLDKTHMGRLKVWIPEFNPVPTESGADRSLFTVSYCSPFAGATPVGNLPAEGSNQTAAQSSYGWWAVPPDIGNEVVVQFINGDPSRGIWIGCLYQQRMNHMVPGLASSESHQEGEEGANPPTLEYNKRDQAQAETETPVRPRFDPLHEGLAAQGLYTDDQRGPSTTSARRDAGEGASKAYGYSTPRGNTIHVDDNEKNEFIRLRTRGGTQILINETIGYIYLISKKGNSWFEISDEGINAFTSRSFNVRAMEGINLHSEGNVSLNAVGQTNFTGSSTSFQVNKDFDLLVPGNFNVTSLGMINLKSYSAMNLSAVGAVSVTAQGYLALQANGAIGLQSSGALIQNGTGIFQNSIPGPVAIPALEASAPQTSDVSDREVNQSKNYPETTTKTIVGVLPTHEPWDGHPLSEGTADVVPVNGESSTPVVYDGTDDTPGDGGRKFASDDTPVPENTTWIVPCSGRVSSRYGPRGKSFHSGIDIAAPIGTPIYATAAGTVIKAGPASGYGQAVYIDHGNGWITEYGHVNSMSVRSGTKVEQGQRIATVGNKGRSSGPHLHLTFRKKGSRGHRNPQDFIAGLRAGNVTAKSK